MRTQPSPQSRSLSFLRSERLQLALEAASRGRAQGADPNAIGVLVGTSLPYLHDSLARSDRTGLRYSRGASRSLLRNAAEAGLQVFVAVAPFMPWDNWRRLQEVTLQVSDGLKPREIFCEVPEPQGRKPPYDGHRSARVAALRRRSVGVANVPGFFATATPISSSSFPAA
jgi:hypothetical protein